MKIAVITGASSGIGREFVRQVGAGECLDEIWVIARRAERLRRLADQCQTPVRPLPLDLTQPAALTELSDLLKEVSPDIALLICAAGFGKIGSYADIPLPECEQMIDLNCRASVTVILSCLPYMNRGGRILAISSTSAFQPFPQLALYAASKAFLLRYARALRWELRQRGIHVTAVCPYWIDDTEFIPTAKEGESSGAIRHFPFAGKAARVARAALRDSRLNFAVSTPGPVCTLHRLLAKFVPHALLMAGWEGLRRI